MAGFEGKTDNEPTTGLGGEQRGPDFSYDRDDLNAREQTPETNDAANENPLGYIDDGGDRGDPGWKRVTNWALDRKKRIVVAVAGLGTALVVLMSLFTVSIAPIAFLDGIMPDLNTAVGSLLMAHNSLLQSKLLYSSEAVSGCKTLSIKCKFSTMSKEQLARYTRAGFKIEGETSKFLGRTKPSSIEFQGKKYTPEEFLTAKKTNISLRNADLRANNMSYLSTKTARFSSWVLTRFGITKQKPGLSGSTTDRVNQLLTSAGKTNPSDISFTQKTDQDGKPTGEWTLDGDGSGTTYTDAQKERALKAAASVKTRPVLNSIQAVQSTATFGNFLKAASITGYIDLGCSLYNMVGAAGVAAKINTMRDLIQFAQPVFALIQSVKAGDETGASDNLAALGTMLTKVDSRETIWDQASGKMVKNPNYNSSAMTSALVAMSGDSEVRPITTETTQFTSALSVESLLGGAGEAYTFLQQSITKGGCALVQNWFVRGASLVVGIFAAIGSGSTSLMATGAVSLAIMGAMYAAQVALSNALHGPDLAAAFDSGSTESLGSALWLGYSYISGSHASSIGMVPGNAEEIVNYDKTVMQETNAAYASMEQEDGRNNPFDTSNQYSFLGSAARQVGVATNYGSSPVSVMAGILALATGSTLSSMGTTASATADLTTDRFSQCPDKSYKELGISPDVACNLRYVMRAADIEKIQKDKAPLTIAEWMEDKGYVEKDTTTGLPIGYVAPSSNQGQSAAEQFVTGAVQGVINQFYNTRQYGTGVAAEYGKFLDFCANRAMPYGEQYAEDGAINGVDPGWITGSKCREDGDVSYFRVYNYFLAAQESEDEEKPVAAQSNTPIGSCPAPGSSVAANLKQGYWDGGYQNAVFCIIDNTTDTSLNGIRDADVFKENNAVLQTNDTGKIVVRADAAQDMINLVQKYKETTKKSTFDATFSYRSHAQQCLMYFYTHKLDNLPNECIGGALTQSLAVSLRSKMTGSYQMPGDFYTSNHESGHAFDASDLGWVNKCASSNYDDGAGSYKDGTCFNFSSDNIPNDQQHVSWKGD